MSNKPLSVSQLNNYLKSIIDAEIMLKNIAVIGEISQYKVVRNIAYFSVKDENSLLNCVLFSADRFENFNSGDKVLLTGSPSYYAKGGKLTFNATKIENYGIGELYKQFLLLKEKLEKEGVFDVKIKKALPLKINNIGVITSSTGAVIQDIRNVVTRRSASTNIILYPAKVQGVGAEDEIIKGIEFFNNYEVDVIIIARGGGSLEDLAPFNTESLARAIFKSKKIVVSAVGHETDFTIADFASDLRAPTPSAAAELVVKDVLEQKEKLNLLVNRLLTLTNNKLTIKENTLTSLLNKLYSLIEKTLTKKENKLALLTNSLSSLNPANLLLKGYAKLEKGAKPINSVKNLKTGEEFTAYLKDGKLIANVKSVEEK